MTSLINPLSSKSCEKRPQSLILNHPQLFFQQQFGQFANSCLIFYRRCNHDDIFNSLILQMMMQTYPRYCFQCSQPISMTDDENSAVGFNFEFQVIQSLALKPISVALPQNANSRPTSRQPLPRPYQLFGLLPTRQSRQTHDELPLRWVQRFD